MKLNKKINRKKRTLYALGYTAFVVLLLMGTRCEQGVTITTPERDVQYIAHLAETIHSENELRKVEQLATRYEIAYRNSLGGAASMRFKRLVEPILIEAGERREAIADQEQYLAMTQEAFHGRLNDLDRAWSLQITTPEEDWALVEQHNQHLDQLRAHLASLIAEKEQLGYDIVEANYNAEMLELMGEVEDQIEATNADIAEVEHTISIIMLAYELQCGETLECPMPNITIELNSITEE